MEQIIRRKAGRPVGTHKGKYPRRPGGRSTRMFSKWSGMVTRCTNPKSMHWKWYGARGITVCERWLGPQGFDNFHDDMGECPAGLTLERKKNDEGYSPENCKWATMAEQGKNRRPGGPKDVNSLRQRALRAGMPYMLVYLRTRLGWSEEKALTTPKLPKGRQLGTRFPKGMDKENAVVAIVPKKPSPLLQKGWV